MRILHKKLFRDLWRGKGEFLSIFFMTLLGIVCFSGVHAYMDGMRVSGDRYYEQNNLPDLWLRSENFTETDLTKIKQNPDIKNAERKLTITTTLDHFDDVTLETNFIESNDISKFHVVEGEAFSNKPGLWIDSYLAHNLNIKIGDQLTLKYQKFSIKQSVVGLINTPDHVYSVKNSVDIFPTHRNFGYVYLASSQTPLKNLPYPEIIATVKDSSNIHKTKTNLEKSHKNLLSVTERSDQISYSAYQSEIEEGDTYSGIFTAIFLFIAIMSVITTMYRFINKQRTQIGTMKALGLKKSKIITHYIAFGFWISFVAGILGIIIGSQTIGRLFLSKELSYLEVPRADISLQPIVYILTAIVIFSITAITYLSCRRILQEKASDAIRVKNTSSTKARSAKINFLKSASLSTKWNLRDILRNKGRTIMGCTGIIGCTMIFVCAFGMLDTMNSYLDWQFDTIYNFNYRLDLEENPQDLSVLTDKYGDTTSQTIGIEIKHHDKKEANTLFIHDAKDKVRLTDMAKRPLALSSDHGIYLTQKLANRLEKKVGDTVSWRIYGYQDWHQSKIIGFNRSPQDQSFSMTADSFKDLNLPYTPDTIYTDKDLSNVKELDGVKIINDKESIKTGTLNMIGTIRSMIIMLISISVALGFIIIYNLSILSLSEKQYQFATLKVLGFRDQQIQKIFVKQNLWIGIFSSIIGLPLGYLLTYSIFYFALGDSFDFPAHIELATYLYSAIGSFVVVWLTNRILVRKITHIDMVSSLKGNE